MPTAQTPIHSGFDGMTASNDVVREISLEGKVAIMTGGYSGIGLETVKSLKPSQHAFPDPYISAPNQPPTQQKVLQI